MATPNTQTMQQFLTFRLESGIFALDIADVREVLEYTVITTVPRMPAHMRGVINLRGNAVPVMDLRLKMRMEQAEPTVDTCIIITEAELDNERTIMGILVDSVREVFEMAPDEIMPPPRMGSLVHREYIAGMGSQNDEFIILLDMDKVLSGEDVALARQAIGDSDARDRAA